MPKTKARANGVTGSIGETGAKPVKDGQGKAIGEGSVVVYDGIRRLVVAVVNGNAVTRKLATRKPQDTIQDDRYNGWGNPEGRRVPVDPAKTTRVHGFMHSLFAYTDSAKRIAASAFDPSIPHVRWA